MAGWISRKTAGFLRRSRFERVWFIPCWILLGVARMLVLCGALPRLARWLGGRPPAHAPEPALDGVQAERARQVGRAIGLAARYAPWDANCLARALVARWLLGRYGIPCMVFFGVARPGADDHAAVDAPMIAHAWVTAGGVPVTGGADNARFTVVGRFMSTCPGTPVRS